MDKKQIVQTIEEFAPLNLAEKWDCSGWIVETDRAKINRVMLCLTVCDDVVRQAISNRCDMIISHHPLFTVPMEYKELDIYCAHTNLDRTEGGTTDTIIKTLGYEQTKLEHDFVRFVNTEISADELISRLREISPNLRYVNNSELKDVKRIAFCAGSGSEFINDAKELGADCYVTGDLKFHTAVDSDILLVDLGHFESEILVLKVFETLLRDKVEIIYAQEKSPFIY